MPKKFFNSKTHSHFVDFFKYLPLIDKNIFYVKERAKKQGAVQGKRLERSEIIFLGLFLGLVLFQLYKTVFYAYADGDDAYYVAVARAAQVSDRLYRSDPYTGMPFMQAKRYFLAPFPLWIAIISRITGLNAAAAAHVAVPLMLIPVSYIDSRNE